MSTLHFNAAGDHGTDQPILIADNPPGGTVLENGFFNATGNRFSINIPPALSGGASVYYQQRRKSFRVIVPPEDPPGANFEAGLPPCLPPESQPEDVALIYTPQTFRLPVPEIHGRYFWVNGQRFFLNGATGFNAYARFLTEGPDAIRALLFQRQSLGFNAIRTWTAYHIDKIGRLIPREHPDFYDRIPEYESLLAEYGQYPYWTCYAGANAETLGAQSDMIAHQLRLQDAIGPWAFLDLHNEFDHPFNAASRFIGPHPPSTVLWSQGSGQQDSPSPMPYGRFYAYHPASFSEWQRKVGKQNVDFANQYNLWLPGVDDETVRLEPGGETNLAHVEDAAECGALFTAGAFLHSRLAKLALPFEGEEYDCAVAWNRGVRKVPLDIAQEGHYTRIDDPNYLRVYVKTLGARSHTAKVRF